MILLLVLSAPLFARIGETEEQCNKRYGGESVPKKVNGGYVFYEMEKFKIIVRIRDGKCTMIEYTSKKDGLTETTIQQLQSLNYPKPWHNPKSNGVSMTITTSEDGHVFSTYESIGKSLQISTKEEVEATSKELAEKEKEFIDGL